MYSVHIAYYYTVQAVNNDYGKSYYSSYNKKGVLKQKEKGKNNTIKKLEIFFEWFFVENPVCKPITETNSEEPSFENVFNVLCAFIMISPHIGNLKKQIYIVY